VSVPPDSSDEELPISRLPSGIDGVSVENVAGAMVARTWAIPTPTQKLATNSPHPVERRTEAFPGRLIARIHPPTRM